MSRRILSFVIAIGLLVFSEPIRAEEPNSTKAKPPRLADIMHPPWFSTQDAQILHDLWNSRNLGELEKSFKFILSRKENSAPKWGLELIWGMLYAETNRFDKAISTLERIPNLPELLEEYRQRWLAQAYLGKQRLKDATLAANAIPQDSIFYPYSLLVLAKTALIKQRYEQAQTLAKQLMNRHPKSRHYLEAMQTLFEAQLAQNQKPLAKQTLLAMFAQFPDDIDQQTIAAQLKKLAVSNKELAAAYIERGNELLGEYDYKEAAKQFDHARALAPKDDITICKARIGKAKAFYGRRRYKNALEHIRKASKVCPATMAWEIDWLKAKTFFKRGMSEDAETLLRRLIKTAPANRDVAQLYVLLARIAFKMDKPKQAYEYAKELFEKTNGKKGGEELWLACWSEYKNGNLEDAAKKMQALLKKEDGIARQRAAYWLGRIAQRQGRKKEASAFFEAALERYPLSFYGLLSARRLEQIDKKEYPESKTLQRKRPIPFKRWRPPRKEFETERNKAFGNQHIQRAAMLLGSGVLDEFAAEEFDIGLSQESSNDAMLKWAIAYMYMHTGRPDKGVWIARRLLYDTHFASLPNEDTYKYWLLAFPQLFYDQIVAAVKKYGRARHMSPELILALIREESSFNPRAGSYANAIGLTQIIKSTAKGIAKRMKRRQFEFTDLFTPQVAIEMGTYHLNSLLRRFKGRLPYAIASYNAGGTRIAKWKKQFSHMEADEFIESMPIAQPRRYTKRLLRSYAIYRFLYGNAHPVLDIRF